jgi:hypothetical protein
MLKLQKIKLKRSKKTTHYKTINKKRQQSQASCHKYPKLATLYPYKVMFYPAGQDFPDKNRDKLFKTSRPPGIHHWPFKPDECFNVVRSYFILLSSHNLSLSPIEILLK